MTERMEKTLRFLKESFALSSHVQREPAAGQYRLEHSLRVARLCGQIARAEGLDEEALIIGGLLHDIAYSAEHPADYPWAEHGRDGAGIARPFLETLGFAPETVEDICYAIAIHVDDQADFPGRRTPFTLTVGDADNIDRFDVFRLYDNLRYRKVFDLPLDERIALLRQTLSRLAQLRDMALGTATAAALWQDKLDYQESFYRRLLEQMEASRWETI